MGSEEIKPKKRARWPKRVIHTGLVLLLLAAAYGAYRWYWIAQVNARHAAIRAEGYPVTLEELDASYKRPTGPNAADVYEEAFSHYVEIAEEKWPLLPIVGDAELPRDGAPLPEETKKLILAHLAANERTLGLLHKAAAVSGCRYPGTLAPGGEWPVAHMRPTPPTWRNCWFSTRW